MSALSFPGLFLLFVQKRGVFGQIVILKRLPHSLLCVWLEACSLHRKIGRKGWSSFDSWEDGVWCQLLGTTNDIQDILDSPY